MGNNGENSVSQGKAELHSDLLIIEISVDRTQQGHELVLYHGNSVEHLLLVVLELHPGSVQQGRELVLLFTLTLNIERDILSMVG